jgi:hypothetical protein
VSLMSLSPAPSEADLLANQNRLLDHLRLAMQAHHTAGRSSLWHSSPSQACTDASASPADGRRGCHHREANGVGQGDCTPQAFGRLEWATLFLSYSHSLTDTDTLTQPNSLRHGPRSLLHYFNPHRLPHHDPPKSSLPRSLSRRHPLRRPFRRRHSRSPVPRSRALLPSRRRKGAGLALGPLNSRR